LARKAADAPGRRDHIRADFEGPGPVETTLASTTTPTGYTVGMKTAISIPDDVFRAAERYARRARKSRSQLYAEALAEYLSRHGPDEVTEAMNGVVAELAEPTDPFVAAAAHRILERAEW
jgi:predicted transcriptional regulator